MDRITQSLQAFLKSAKIQYQTLYNSDTGNKTGNPTSTSFHVRNSKDPRQSADIVIDIFPKDSQFFLSSHPKVVMLGEGNKIKALESRWNAIGMLTRISVSEEMGIIENDRFCFQLMLRGISDQNGLSKYVWQRYFDILKRDTFEAWNKMDALYMSEDFYSF